MNHQLVNLFNVTFQMQWKGLTSSCKNLWTLTETYFMNALVSAAQSHKRWFSFRDQMELQNFPVPRCDCPKIDTGDPCLLWGCEGPFLYLPINRCIVVARDKSKTILSTSSHDHISWIVPSCHFFCEGCIVTRSLRKQLWCTSLLSEKLFGPLETTTCEVHICIYNILDSDVYMICILYHIYIMHYIYIIFNLRHFRWIFFRGPTWTEAFRRSVDLPGLGIRGKPGGFGAAFKDRDYNKL